MKTFNLKFLAVLICSLFLRITAQSPNLINYQAIVRSAGNTLAMNKAVGVKVSILQNTATGTVVYQELFAPNPTTNANGLLTLQIGSGTPQTGTLAGINWNAGPYFVKTEIDPNGGTTYSLVSTSQLLSVPYALSAKTAQSVAGIAGTVNKVAKFSTTGTQLGDSQIFDGVPGVGIGTVSPSYKLDVEHGGSTGIRSKSTSTFSVIDIDAFNGDAALRFANNGTNQWNLRNQPGTDDFQLFELGGGGQRFLVQNNTGNVSIGGSQPAYRLDVEHGGATGIRSRSTDSYSLLDIDAFNGDAALRFIKNGVSQWNIRNDPANDNLQVFELGGGGERLVVQNTTGNVGINMSTPTARLHVGGNFTATGVKAFTIDHPLDPENKILRHFSIESNEVINIYSGNSKTDESGKVMVKLPDYFDAINKDFRYQLTVIGTFAQAIISKKILSNQFEISTNIPNVEVSWEVKGVRNDPYMKNVNMMKAEELKPTNMRGKYIEPKAYQLSENRGVNYNATKSGDDSINSKIPNVTSKKIGKNSGGSLEDIKNIPPQNK